MRHSRSTLLAGLFLTSFAVSACAPAPERPESGGHPDQKVTVQAFEFRPGDIHIEAGVEVMWVNGDNILHTVTSGTAGEQGVPGVSEDLAPSPDGLFDLELAGQASTARFMFQESGTYAYFCAIHSGMSGTVNVV